MTDSPATHTAKTHELARSSLSPTDRARNDTMATMMKTGRSVIHGVIVVSPLETLGSPSDEYGQDILHHGQNRDSKNQCPSLGQLAMIPS